MLVIRTQGNSFCAWGIETEVNHVLKIHRDCKQEGIESVLLCPEHPDNIRIYEKSYKGTHNIERRHVGIVLQDLCAFQLVQYWNVQFQNITVLPSSGCLYQPA